jgi:hypothetical protein
MKTTLFGVVAGAMIAAVVGSLLGHESAVFAERPSVYDTTGRLDPTNPTGQLIALPTQVDNNRQQITVIDPIKRVICVYHLDLPSGGITLKSVRNIAGDLQIDDFNGTSPLPREVRSQLEPR